jgi:hypothetical protein
LTWPNLITVVRLAALPLFFWLLFGTNHRAIAAWLLATLGATDWIDGFVARRWHQVSNVGKILDPVADRVLVISGLLAVAAAAGVPWWFALGDADARTDRLDTDARARRARRRAHRRAVVGEGLDVCPDDDLPALFAHDESPPRGVATVAARRARRLLGDRLMGLTLSWIVLAGYVKPALRALRTGRQARRIL